MLPVCLACASASAGTPWAGQLPNDASRCDHWSLRPNQSATLRLPAPPLLSEILLAPQGTVRLSLEGLRPAGHGIGLRVFIDEPVASAETPITDPHYAGSAVVPATSREPATVFMNIRPALQRLRSSPPGMSREIAITVIALPLPSEMPVPDFTIQLKCAGLKVIR